MESLEERAYREVCLALELQSIRDDIWRMVLNDEFGDYQLDTKRNLGPLIAAVKGHLVIARAFPKRRMRTATTRPASEARQVALDRTKVLSRFVAEEAASREDVSEFRRLAFPGGRPLLAPAEVVDWIDARYDAGDYSGVDPTSRAPRPFRALRLYRDDGAWVWDVDPASLLGKLADLCVALTAAYRWPHSLALEFALTDWYPPIPSIEVRAELSDTHPFLHRIVLTIDPATAPEEILAHYLKMRREELKVDRYRDVGPEILALARLALRRAGSPRAALMAEWNKSVLRSGRKWNTYTSVSRFNRDAERARHRLLGERPTTPRRKLLKRLGS